MIINRSLILSKMITFVRSNKTRKVNRTEIIDIVIIIIEYSITNKMTAFFNIEGWADAVLNRWEHEQARACVTPDILEEWKTNNLSYGVSIKENNLALKSTEIWISGHKLKSRPVPLSIPILFQCPILTEDDVANAGRRLKLSTLNSIGYRKCEEGPYTSYGEVESSAVELFCQRFGENCIPSLVQVHADGGFQFVQALEFLRKDWISLQLIKLIRADSQYDYYLYVKTGPEKELTWTHDLIDISTTEARSAFIVFVNEFERRTGKPWIQRRRALWETSTCHLLAVETELRRLINEKSTVARAGLTKFSVDSSPDVVRIGRNCKARVMGPITDFVHYGRSINWGRPFMHNGNVVGFIRAEEIRTTTDFSNAFIFMPMNVIKGGTTNANRWFNEHPVVVHLRNMLYNKRINDLKAPEGLFGFRCTFSFRERETFREKNHRILPEDQARLPNSSSISSIFQKNFRGEPEPAFLTNPNYGLAAFITCYDDVMVADVAAGGKRDLGILF